MNASTILNLPPEVLATIPSGVAPAGITALSDHPARRGYILITVNAILAVIMTICFTIRMYTSLVIRRRITWSDFFLLVGFLFVVMLYVAAIIVVSPGGTVGMHSWDVSLLSLFSKRNTAALYILAILIMPAFGFVKLSIFLMYLEIFEALRWMKICVYIGATFCSAFYLAGTILLFYLSTPFGSETFRTTFFSPRQLMFFRVGIPMAAISLGIDVYLFTLPLCAVSNLHIPTKKKILVMVGFAVGLIACVGSLLSLIYRVIMVRSDDKAWKGVSVVIAILVELFSGVIICCFPSLLLFFRRHHEHFANTGAAISSWLRYSRYRKSDTSIKEPQYSSYPSERTPAGEVNLYPNLDFLTTPGDIERTALEKRMENRIGIDAIAV
ncbi:uncharacterized protein EAE97_004822 [Botrytis byssoidea]|uniref:Rhodopsin domain-containing protein n=1 Tax=Botrytis byssoidea TaxID=139641 RepID=A0A9P5LVK1_9HELO|nr:uncharacterized protein EAE97_004822 [Botrytis byssoidea]KAF7945784.1 hypothetical protein EAE97_004822 [Botrytis byssoidea]